MNHFAYNYHTHTTRCGHASGKDEEYVLKAIKANYKRLGFSDHVMLPGITQIGMRGKYEELEGYVSSIRHLEQNYKEKISIKLGFECEWYGNAYKDYYADLLASKKVDYLILGQHCFLENAYPKFYARLEDVDKAERMYVNDLIEAMESGLFSYVCHPDLFIQFAGVRPAFKEDSYRIAKAAKANHLPLEINLAPSRYMGFPPLEAPYFKTYPFPPFWEIVKEVGNEIVVGVDAHNPEDFLSTDYESLQQFISFLGLKVNDDFKI